MNGWMKRKIATNHCYGCICTVRRNAVFALGFVFADAPTAFLPTAKLLLQSYHSHIRYAAALVSGLINAGSAHPELSEPLLKLMDDSVRIRRVV